MFRVRVDSEPVVDERKQYVNPCSVVTMAHRAYLDWIACIHPTEKMGQNRFDGSRAPTNLNTCSGVPRRLEKSTGVTSYCQVGNRTDSEGTFGSAGSAIVELVARGDSRQVYWDFILRNSICLC
jgi:hypothetical protein